MQILGRFNPLSSNFVLIASQINLNLRPRDKINFKEASDKFLALSRAQEIHIRSFDENLSRAPNLSVYGMSQGCFRSVSGLFKLLGYLVGHTDPKILRLVSS